MRPTQEQIKEFWEWCGIYTSGYWQYSPNKKQLASVYNPIPITLDNLFKYGVTKVTKELLMPVELLSYPSRSYGYHVCINNKPHNGDYNDPALALFWAIYNLITTKEVRE